MRREIHDYQINDHGAHKPQRIHESYVNYHHAAYGEGRNFSEALDNALDEITQIADLGVLADEEVIERIKEENVSQTADRRYVSIRYNTSEVVPA